MKKILFALSLISGNLYAVECNDIIHLQKINMKSVLADNLTRRIYEEYINKGWLELGRDVYVQSSQGQVVNRMTLMTMSSLYNFHVQRLKEALDPSYGSGIHINSESIKNEINSCLSQEQKEKCSNQLSDLYSNIKEFENYQNKYKSNMHALVSMIDVFYNDVHSASNSGQVYPANNAFNYINSIVNNTDESTQYKGWLNISNREAEKSIDETEACIWN